MNEKTRRLKNVENVECCFLTFYKKICQPHPNSVYFKFLLSQFNDKFNRQIVVSDQMQSWKKHKLFGSNKELLLQRRKLMAQAVV